MSGVVQILPWRYEDSLKHYLDANCKAPNLKTVQVGSGGSMSDEDRDRAIKDGIVGLLGKVKKPENNWTSSSLG